MKRNLIYSTVISVWIFLHPAMAQDKHHYQTDFSKEEFAERRMKIVDAIGKNGIAVIQGASGIPGFTVFRQANTFYYLTGLESPHAYLLINGKNKQVTLYLPHRDVGMEQNQGKVFSAEDAERTIKEKGLIEIRPPVELPLKK